MHESIDAFELARRWNIPVTWVRNHTRDGYTDDPIPHRKLAAMSATNGVLQICWTGGIGEKRHDNHEPATS